MNRMIKKRSKKINTFCTTMGNFLFLQAHYGWEYTGQIMIKNPKKDIPKLIKVLKKGLIEFNKIEIDPK